MRNKPRKLYILLGAGDEPYRVGGKVRAYNSAGRAIKQSKRLYETRAQLFKVVRCEMALSDHADYTHG